MDLGQLFRPNWTSRRKNRCCSIQVKKCGSRDFKSLGAHEKKNIKLVGTLRHFSLFNSTFRGRRVSSCRWRRGGLVPRCPEILYTTGLSVGLYSVECTDQPTVLPQTLAPYLTDLHSCLIEVPTSSSLSMLANISKALAILQRPYDSYFPRLSHGQRSSSTGLLAISQHVRLKPNSFMNIIRIYSCYYPPLHLETRFVNRKAVERKYDRQRQNFSTRSPLLTISSSTNSPQYKGGVVLSKRLSG